MDALSHDATDALSVCQLLKYFLLNIPSQEVLPKLESTFSALRTKLGDPVKMAEDQWKACKVS